MKFTLNYGLHIRFVVVKILFWGIMRKELGICISFTMLLPYIKKVIQPPNILSGYIDAIAYYQSCYFLTFILLLQPGLFLIDDKLLSSNNGLKFLLELLAFLKDIPIATECDIISVS